MQTDFGVPSTDASGVHRRWRANSLPISKVQICTIDFSYVIQCRSTSTIGICTLYAQLLSAQYLSISLVIRLRITILELLCMFSILVSKPIFPRHCKFIKYTSETSNTTRYNIRIIWEPGVFLNELLNLLAISIIQVLPASQVISHSSFSKYITTLFLLYMLCLDT